MNKKKNIHLILGLVILAILVLLGIILSNKFKNFGRPITKDQIDAIEAPDEIEEDDFNYIIPVPYTTAKLPEDDGVTTVLFLGNSYFNDDRDAENGLCNIFAEKTGATVYNCSIPNSYMTAAEATFQDYNPLDAFSFYFLSYAFTHNNYSYIDRAYEATFGNLDYLKDTVDTLKNIDFEKIDAIFIMYDATDYYYSRICSQEEALTSPNNYAGALAAGLEDITETYPWIRVIVVSPTCSFTPDSDGNLISCNRQKNNATVYLSTYMHKAFETSYIYSVSYLDVFYSGIHEENADQYLIDHMHLNEEGRELVVDRMIEALGKYTTIY